MQPLHYSSPCRPPWPHKNIAPALALSRYKLHAGIAIVLCALLAAPIPALAFRIVGAESVNGRPVAEIMSTYQANLKASKKKASSPVASTRRNQRQKNVTSRHSNVEGNATPANFTTGSSMVGLRYLAEAGANAPRLRVRNLFRDSATTFIVQQKENTSGSNNKVARIVAVVNNEPITYTDLLSRVKSLKSDLSSSSGKLPPQDEIEKQVLRRMILDVAQLQLARRSGIMVSDRQLEIAIQRIAKKEGKSLAAFKRSIKAKGIPFVQFRKELRDEITIARLRNREVRIRVSDNEVDSYLAMKSAIGQGKEYRVAHILIRVTEGMSPSEKRRQELRAKQMLRRMKIGQKFRNLAITFSDAPDARNGGDLGWRTQDRLPNLFKKLIKKIKPGETSDVVRSQAGFHVLHFIAERHTDSSADKAIQQTRARHILLTTDSVLSDEEAASRLQVLRQRIIQGEDFAELARFNSKDGSAAKGGDLGWVYPGDTVPEFEHAMNSLQTGDISQPVQSPFGWHLIKVVERREAPISEERRRQNARQLLHRQKMEESYEAWLQQLRDSTYIENRLEPSEQ